MEIVKRMASRGGKSEVKRESGHAFSIELKSKEFLRNVVISDRTGERVLVEGFLGELEETCLVEGSMLELRGRNGVLRVDLKEEELERLLDCLPHRRLLWGGKCQILEG